MKTIDKAVDLIISRLTPEERNEMIERVVTRFLEDMSEEEKKELVMVVAPHMMHGMSMMDIMPKMMMNKMGGMMGGMGGMMGGMNSTEDKASTNGNKKGGCC